MNDEKPFYINPSGKNVINENHIQEFKSLNLELSDFIDTFPIELRLIDLSTFEAFCAWIFRQQISGRVADIITNRFFAKLNKVTPKNVLRLSTTDMKEIGLSKQKMRYLMNLAEFFITEGEMELTDKISSDEIIKYYSQIKGIGEWTVQMQLIFGMGRLDILATKDLVVRKGIQRLYGLADIPNEKTAKRICKKWGSLATLGTILSWSIMGE